MESKKFKELKVGDTIYFCNNRHTFNKVNILNGNVLQVKIFNIDKIRYENKFIIFEDFKLGRCLCFNKNVMKSHKTYNIYSTSKEYIDKCIKQFYNSYITSLKEKIKDGKRAEKDLKELNNITF